MLHTKRIISSLALFVLLAPSLFAQGQKIVQRTAMHLPAARVDELRERIAHTSFERHLYAHIFRTALDESTGAQRQNARIARAAAFVALLRLDAEGKPLCDSIRELARLRSRALLAGLSPAVQSSGDEWQWRAVELTAFAEAYDLLLAGGDAQDSGIERQLAAFAAQADKRLSSLLAPDNNLTLKLAGSLGSASLALRHLEGTSDSARPSAWMAHALEVIDGIVWGAQSNSTGKAGYSEGPYYFRYAMLQLLPLFHALETVGSETAHMFPQPLRAPLRDARWNALFDWISDIRLPDGRLPAFEDTYMNTRFPELAILSILGPREARHAWPMTQEDGSPISEDALFATMDETCDFRVEYLCAGAKPGGECAPRRAGANIDAGYAVLQQGSSWLGMIGKHGIARTHGSIFGSGHKQANEGAFIFHARGQLLAIEPGYPSYDMRDSVIYSRNHNVMLVDGKGPDATGYPGFLIGTDTWIGDTLASPRLSRASASTSYQGASILRNILLVDGIGILVDRVAATGTHTYTQQVHGNGSASDGSFEMDDATGTARWTSGNAQLTCMTAASGTAPRAVIAHRTHAPSYKTLATHATLLTEASGKNAAFVSLLIPARAGDSIRPARLGGNGWTGVLLQRSEGTLLAAANGNGGIAHLDAGATRISSDAAFAVLSCRDADTVLYVAAATSLSFSQRTMFQSDVAVSALLAYRGDTLSLLVDAPASTELRVPLRFVPLSMTLPNGAWRIEGSTLRIEAPAGRSNFEIVFSRIATGADAPIPVSGTFRISAPWPNPVPSRGAEVVFEAALPRESDVTVTIANILGQSVAIVPLGSREAGLQRLRVRVPRVAPGTYYFRVSAGEAVATRFLQIVP